jgi:acetyl esterase/lipase
MVPIHRRAFVAGSAAAIMAADLAQADVSPEPKTGWADMSHAARDAAYNNGAAVANSTLIIDRWVADSVAFRAKHPAHVDLAYGPGERNKWDLFPSDNPKAPCLVFIHGGYWQARNREHFSCFAEGVMARGWSCAMSGYTLAPAATLTQIVAEIRAALDWLAAEGSAHGIAGPVILSGWSAGGASCGARLGPSPRQSGLFNLGDFRAWTDPRHLSQ